MSLDLCLQAASWVLRVYKQGLRGLCGLWFNSWVVQGVTILPVPHSIRIKSRAIGIIKRTIFWLRLPEGLLQRLLMVGVFYTICYIFISSLCVCKIAFVWEIGLTRTVKENCKQIGTHTWRYLPYVFSFQKAAVGSNLLLKPGLYVQKGIVLLVLAFCVTPDLHQLGLQGAQHSLEGCQLAGITSLGFLQGALQRLFLRVADKECFLFASLK